MLSTSIVNGAVTGGTSQDGLLYNSLVLGSVNTVKAVNVTATGEINGTNDSGNNRQEVTKTNSYVTEDYWKYQLMETSADIDPNPDDDPRTDISEYMKKVGHERDLIGNARIRNIVDNGCFETWNITAGMTTDSDGHVEAYPVKATDYPVGKSVVYVRKNQELKIQNATDGSLLYKDESSAFNPGFLLLEHQAGLRGNGNFISLTNFAVERDIPAGGADLVAMPFKIVSEEPIMPSLPRKYYDGNVRAAYSYLYDETESKAWVEQKTDIIEWTEGFLIENPDEKQEQTVRFYGNEYKEEGTDKSISLNKYNFNEQWTSGTTGYFSRVR